jgi:type I protein arginine methyltransferase
MEYALPDYGRMMRDTVRTDAFARALERAVTADSVVLDLGCGAGIFSLISCRLGARRIFAIEKDEVIEVAREIARRAGYARRIEFIQDSSKNVVLPERANVVVSDIRGALPLYSQHLPSIIDARERLLAPDGVLIPKRDILMAAVVEAPELYYDRVSSWEDQAGFDMEPAREMAVNMWFKERSSREWLISEAEQVGVLDYSTVESVNFSAEIGWRIDKSATAHGFLLWFDTELVEGVGYSCAPGEPITLYGNAFFPFQVPVPIERGDYVRVGITAGLIEDDYVWSWRTLVSGSGAEREKARFSQSTVLGVPISERLLERSLSTYVPELSEEGRMLYFALEMMGGDRSLDEIAVEVHDRFADRFATVDEALTLVTRLAHKYSR